MIKKFAMALFFMGVVCPFGANAFVVDSICYQIYYNVDRLEYEVGVTEHDMFQNYEMYVGDVVIPESVTYESVSYKVSKICSSAFYGCSYLRSVRIPKTVQLVDYEGNTFELCTNLESILVDAENEAYCDVNGVLFTKDMSTLVAYPRGRQGKYDIPGVAQIVGDVAFYKCRRLLGVTLPESINEIRVGAFRECDDLTTVISRNPVPPVLASSSDDDYLNVFGNVKPDTLRVPRAAIDAYRNATEWNLFAHILPIDGDCDLTGDNKVDIADVNRAIDIMLGKYAQDHSDVSGDGTVDIVDVNVIINSMLGKE